MKYCSVVSATGISGSVRVDGHGDVNAKPSYFEFLKQPAYFRLMDEDEGSYDEEAFLFLSLKLLRS